MRNMRPLFAAAMLLLPVMEHAVAQQGPVPTNPSTIVQATHPAATPLVADPWMELAKSLPWPIAAIVIACLLYHPLVGFITAIGGRITKLSLFKVELELKPAEAAATLLLDDLRTATTAAAINNSSKMMLLQVQSGSPAHYATIALGSGEDWWTSRLYIAAAMMQRMRGVQVFVFVERTPTSEQRVVAVAPVGQLRWAMAQRYPWLELAWVRANLTALNPQPPSTLVVPPGQPPYYPR